VAASERGIRQGVDPQRRSVYPKAAMPWRESGRRNSQSLGTAAVARAIRRQLAFGLRRTIPLALPRDFAIVVARFVAEAITWSHGATSPLMRSARKSTIILSSWG